MMLALGALGAAKESSARLIYSGIKSSLARSHRSDRRRTRRSQATLGCTASSASAHCLDGPPPLRHPRHRRRTCLGQGCQWGPRHQGGHPAVLPNSREPTRSSAGCKDDLKKRLKKLIASDRPSSVQGSPVALDLLAGSPYCCSAVLAFEIISARQRPAVLFGTCARKALHNA